MPSSSFSKRLVLYGKIYLKPTAYSKNKVFFIKCQLGCVIFEKQKQVCHVSFVIGNVLCDMKFFICHYFW